MPAEGKRSPVNEGDVVADKYRVEKVLGVGGMGIVVAARHVTLDQRVAIKFLHRDALKETEWKQRFLREAKSAVRLKSEHVARVLDVATLPSGEPYMVMEHLDGADLGELVDEGRINPGEAVSYIRQACDALAEAHDLGIVHRDLKPENLFLTDLGRGRTSIKVLDFGISKSTDASNLSLTQTTAVMGSPLYMSPEQMKASRNVDARTDIWALGVTLYEMICGDVPFVAESAMALGAKVMHEQPRSPSEVRPDIPVELSAVILKCLEKDPKNRYSSVTELQDALQPFETAALPTSPSRRRVVSIPSSEALAMGTTMSASGAVSINTSRTLANARNKRFAIYALVAMTVAVGALAFVHRSQPTAAVIVSQDLLQANANAAPAASMHVASASTPSETPVAVETVAVPSATSSASKASPPRHATAKTDPARVDGARMAHQPADTTSPPPPTTASARTQAPEDPYGHM